MMMIRTTCKAVNCFSNVARVKYLIVTSYLHLHRHLLLFYIRLGSHFCQHIKHIPLKKMMIRTTCKAVNCFSNVARVKYLIVTSYLHLHRHLLLFYIRLGSHFCQHIKHIPLKKMMIRTTCKAVNYFSNVLIVTSHLHVHRHLLLSRRYRLQPLQITIDHT